MSLNNAPAWISARRVRMSGRFECMLVHYAKYMSYSSTLGIFGEQLESLKGSICCGIGPELLEHDLPPC